MSGMIGRMRSIGLLFVVAGAAACAEDGPGIVAPDVEPLSLAKGPPAPNPTAKWVVPADPGGQANGMWGDGLFQNSYTHGECGVEAVIYAPGGSLDATLSTTASNKKQRCADYPRKLTLRYVSEDSTQPFEETFAVFSNVRKLASVLPGQVDVSLTFAIRSDGPSRCGGYLFVESGPVVGETEADNVLVSATALGGGRTRWHVRSNPEPGKNLFLCESDGLYYHMNVDFQIESL